MEKIISRFSTLKSKIDSLLSEDFDFNTQERAQIQNNFQVDTNTSHIRDLAIGLPRQHVDRAVAIFQRLSTHFEAGLFFENQDGTYKLFASFEKGIVSPVRVDPRPSILLPHITLMTVLQTSADNILQKIPQVQFQNSNNMRAFLIKISSDFSFVFFSEMPDPWMKNHIEEVIKALHLAMGEG